MVEISQVRGRTYSIMDLFKASRQPGHIVRANNRQPRQALKWQSPGRGR